MKELAIAAALGGAGVLLKRFNRHHKQGDAEVREDCRDALQQHLSKIQNIADVIALLGQQGHPEAAEALKTQQLQMAKQARSESKQANIIAKLQAHVLEQQERIDQQAIELINDNGNTQLLDEIATLEEAMAAKILEVRRLEHAQEGYQARCKAQKDLKQKAEEANIALEGQRESLHVKYTSLKREVEVCKAAHANAISKLVCEKAALEQKVERQHLQGEARSKGILEQVRREREAKERAEAELVAARQTSGQEGQTALQAFNQLKSQSEGERRSFQAVIDALRAQMSTLEVEQATKLADFTSKFQAKDGLLRDLEVTHTATLEDLESRLQAEVQELTSQASASSTTIQELRRLLEEQADQLEVAVGAKKSTDRVLKRSDSSLHDATEKIKALHNTVEEHTRSSKEARAEAAQVNTDKARLEKALLDTRASLDKKAKECHTITSKLDVLMQHHQSLKKERNELDSTVRVLTAGQGAADKKPNTPKAPKKRSEGASSKEGAAISQQGAMLPAEPILGGSGASPDHEKETKINNGADSGTNSAHPNDTCTGEPDGAGWSEVPYARSLSNKKGSGSKGPKRDLRPTSSTRSRR